MHILPNGYTSSELDDAQKRYGLRFPPDLVELLMQHQPIGGYDWRGENRAIRQMLAWPVEMLTLDVEKGFWWPDWGLRPTTAERRSALVESAIRKAPRLIPIIKHRFIPEEPHQTGNPVFSMHGFDTIYYGANLTEFFRNEFENRYDVSVVRHIPFWSDLAERHDEAYSLYAARKHIDERSANVDSQD